MIASLNDEFWQEEDQEAEDALVALYVLLLLYGVSSGMSYNVGGVDFDAVTNFLGVQAANYGSILSGINQTTRKRVEQVVIEWQQSGLGLDVLDYMLEPVFSEGRANVISITEVTKALALGQTAVWAASDVEEMVWHTAEDGRVCPECAARRNLVFDADSSDVPPLHPGCRCWLEPK
jgi:SPP1 gp7 family putative phage head morphogenesis protein